MIDLVIIATCAAFASTLTWPSIEYEKRPKAWHLLAAYLALNALDYVVTVFFLLPNGIPEGNEYVLYLGGPTSFLPTVQKMLILPAITVAGTWATGRWGGERAKRLARRLMLLLAFLFLFTNVYNSAAVLEVLAGQPGGATTALDPNFVGPSMVLVSLILFIAWIIDRKAPLTMGQLTAAFVGGNTANYMTTMLVVAHEKTAAFMLPATRRLAVIRRLITRLNLYSSKNGLIVISLYHIVCALALIWYTMMR